LIHLENVQQAFGNRTVLRGVSLAVPRGCLYGLIGPGASGKSVVLKVIAGLIRPSEGRVLIEGQNLADLSDLELQSYRQRFGMLFQNNALFDYLTVAENIAFPLRRLLDLSESEIAERVRERLDLVGLGSFAEAFPKSLSGGQKKRIGVARATVTRAPILLYDEPAAGLDPVTSQRLFDLLRSEQRAASSTVVMVSTDLDRLLSVTDRVGMMYNGELIFDGTTAEAQASRDARVHQFVHGEVDGPL
jgi:phospholipid/cholesterol/gamma-HCH transport system ATP-binding protein